MKHIYNFLLVLTCIPFVTSCGTKKEDKEPVEKTAPRLPDEVSLNSDQYKIAGIELGTVEMRNLTSVIRANGVLDVPPQNIVSISAPLGGYIKSAGLLPGQPIKKGEVMAVIENPEFIDIQQDYLESKGKMEFLELELKRQEELRREDINAAKTLQQANSDYKVMKAKISGLEQKLSMIGINYAALQSGKIVRTSNLYAPISGYVTESNINMGKYVTATDVLFQLTDKRNLHLALNLFEKDVPFVKVGQPIKFALADENDYSRQAKVFLIGKAKASDGMIPVHCHLMIDKDAALIPGLYVKAWIETSNSNTASLPSQAIVQSEGKDYIFTRLDTIQNKTKFKMIPVIKGLEKEGFAAVTLPQNFNISSAVVVLKGAYSLLSAIKNVEE